MITSTLSKYIVIDTDYPTFLKEIRNPYTKLTLVQTIENKIIKLDKSIKFAFDN